MRGTEFLPVSRQEMEQRGWDGYDFLVVTADAYIDHPSFGTAIIGRVLEDAGFSVGIISQPDWRSAKDFLRLGLPRYAFCATPATSTPWSTTTPQPKSAAARTPTPRAVRRESGPTVPLSSIRAASARRRPGCRS